MPGRRTTTRIAQHVWSPCQKAEIIWSVFFALTQIVFTASFSLTDRYGKPNSKKKTGTQVEQFSRLAPSRTVTSYSSFFGEAEPV